MEKQNEYVDKAWKPVVGGMWQQDELFTNAALGCRAACEQVKAIPAADVVPVVRCSECKYNGHCFTQSFVRDEGIIPFDPDTWFCADGKRTDGEA